MFFQSVIQGFNIFTHWQVWVAIIMYVAIYFAYLISLNTFFNKDDTNANIVVGCLVYTFGELLIHAFLMGSMIAFLLPILLGGTSATPVLVVISSLWSIIKIGLFATIAVMIIGFIPPFGQMISRTPGVQAFLEGLIIFRIFSSQIIYQLQTTSPIDVIIYPGFWATIGFIIIALALVTIVIIVLTFISVYLENTVIGELMPEVLGPIIGVLSGFLPLFMYSTYVRLAIQANYVGVNFL